MNPSKHMDFRRLFLLIRRDLLIQSSTYLVSLSAIFGLLFIANMVSIVSADSWSFHLVFFPLFLFLGGFAFTSAGFAELNRGRSRAFYLSLPASSLEKFTARLLVTGPGWALIWLALYSLFSIVAYGLTNLIFGTGHRLFDPFHMVAWEHIRVYLVTQSIFLLGAVTFRGNVFWKCVLWILALLLGYMIFVGGFAYLFHWLISLGGRPYISFRIFDLSLQQGPPGTILSIAGHGIHILFWYVMPPFLWLVTYVRLKEAQA